MSIISVLRRIRNHRKKSRPAATSGLATPQRSDSFKLLSFRHTSMTVEQALDGLSVSGTDSRRPSDTTLVNYPLNPSHLMPPENPDLDNGPLAFITCGPQCANCHDELEHDHYYDHYYDDYSEEETVAPERLLVVTFPGYKREYCHYPQLPDGHPHALVRFIRVRIDDTIAEYIQMQIASMRDETKGAVLDSIRSSMTAEVDLNITADAWVQLPLVMNGSPPPLNRFIAGAGAEEHFLPGSDLHSFFDKKLQRIGDAIDAVIRDRYGQSALTTVKLALDLEASVRVLDESDHDVAPPLPSPTAPGSSSLPPQVAFPTHSYESDESSESDTPPNPNSDDRPASDAENGLAQLNKYNLKDFVFVAKGGYYATRRRRLFSVQIKVKQPKSYWRILSAHYNCPNAVNELLHWTHGPEDIACSMPGVEYVYACDPTHFDENGKLIEGHTINEGIFLGETAHFMEAYARLLE